MGFTGRLAQAIGLRPKPAQQAKAVNNKLSRKSTEDIEAMVELGADEDEVWVLAGIFQSADLDDGVCDDRVTPEQLCEAFRVEGTTRAMGRVVFARFNPAAGEGVELKDLIWGLSHASHDPIFFYFQLLDPLHTDWVERTQVLDDLRKLHSLADSAIHRIQISLMSEEVACLPQRIDYPVLEAIFLRYEYITAALYEVYEAATSYAPLAESVVDRILYASRIRAPTWGDYAITIHKAATAQRRRRDRRVSMSRAPGEGEYMDALAEEAVIEEVRAGQESNIYGQSHAAHESHHIGRGATGSLGFAYAAGGAAPASINFWEYTDGAPGSSGRWGGDTGAGAGADGGGGGLPAPAKTFKAKARQMESFVVRRATDTMSKTLGPITRVEGASGGGDRGGGGGAAGAAVGAAGGLAGTLTVQVGEELSLRPRPEAIKPTRDGPRLSALRKPVQGPFPKSVLESRIDYAMDPVREYVVDPVGDGWHRPLPDAGMPRPARRADLTAPRPKRTWVPRREIHMSSPLDVDNTEDNRINQMQPHYSQPCYGDRKAELRQRASITYAMRVSAMDQPVLAIVPTGRRASAQAPSRAQDTEAPYNREGVELNKAYMDGGVLAQAATTLHWMRPGAVLGADPGGPAENGVEEPPGLRKASLAMHAHPDTAIRPAQRRGGGRDRVQVHGALIAGTGGVPRGGEQAAPAKKGPRRWQLRRLGREEKGGVGQAAEDLLGGASEKGKGTTIEEYGLQWQAPVYDTSQNPPLKDGFPPMQWP